MAIEVIRSGAPAGAEITGVDISAGVDEETFIDIRNALHEYGVVVLREQRISPEQQLGFCRRFGNFEPHAVPQYLVPGYQDLLCVSNILDDNDQPIGLIDAGRVWHTDGHFDERPNMYSMLYALEIPRDEQGRTLGSTWFLSTAAAYDSLPLELKRRLEGMRADNSLAAVYQAMKRIHAATKRAPLSAERQAKVVTHPVVRTHPATGRKCIYVSQAATLRIHGLSDEESRALIDELHAICVREEMIYRHRWEVGDLLLWDNCSTQHYAVGDYALPQRRLMHRTTIEGAVPV
ncbi:TauD/TfdA family dioxygenase [Bordetella sp. BOR01]|uniref:TauD/TfdA dioxygenase family protein n=1 Tax=Bordetella sp. BOR01 TaxID=2854779 RepID=UPI001C45BEE5|nr:TauD/TfdA family dioxygenase [Bordetella sp. BOR01]MBV7483680.1 TauD/TfdA family dioxygenase [Bordetella sp. BOR01]